jgi:hypothetical protein
MLVVIESDDLLDLSSLLEHLVDVLLGRAAGGTGTSHFPIVRFKVTLAYR